MTSNPMWSPVFRAQLAGHIANARISCANAIPALTHAESSTLTDAHREELSAIQAAHAALIHASRLLAR